MSNDGILRRRRAALTVVAILPLLLGATTPGRAAHAHRGGVSAYNGAWLVSTAGFCTGLGSGQVTIIDGRIIGPNGAGRVTASGALHTISNVNGFTTVSNGRIVGDTASGSYQQSDGCVGTWTAVKQ